MLKQIALCSIIYLSTVYAATIDEEDVKYYLYTSKNPNTSVIYSLPLPPLKDFDPSNPVKILCHGFVDNATGHWIEPTKNAYMATGNFNVISVDWSKIAYEMYGQAYLKIPAVGDHVAQMIISLTKTYNISLSDIHVIGFSLGAQISGYAGKKIIESTKEKLGRITGLDPAGPLYELTDDEHHLSPNDAIFVDSIHTNAGLLGYIRAAGHADFWPNGGTAQNGCKILSSCSHLRAPLYFAESIEKRIPAYECSGIILFNLKYCFKNKMAVMGEHCYSSTRGNFYLRTNKAPPYAIMFY